LKQIYLDNAATSRFKPLRAYIAAFKHMKQSANAGRSAHSAALNAAIAVETCRETVNKYFFDGNVMFTKNCTEALNLAINGLNPKNHVITTVYEHNSVLRPLHRLASTGKFALTVLSPSTNGFESALNAVLRHDTSLVVVTAVGNVNGLETNVEALAKLVKEKSNATVLVDTAQSAGHLRLSYENIDIIAAPSHKGLHGFQGSGFLLAKPHISLTALITGGTGSSTLSLEHPNTIPDGMEAGTLNTFGIAALNAGLEWTFKNFARINAKTDRLSKILREGLSSIGGVTVHKSANGIVLITADRLSPTDLSDALASRFNVCARAGLHCAPLMHKHLNTAPLGALRFSVGFNNSVSDIEKTVDAVETILHEI